MFYGSLPISLPIFNIGNLTFKLMLFYLIIEAMNEYDKDQTQQLEEYFINGITNSGILSLLSSQTTFCIKANLTLF